MKIAHIVSTFPPHLGGMGSVCWHEADLLSDKGHDVTVFTLKYPDTVYDDTINSFSVVRIPALFKYGDAGEIPQLAWHLKEFDLVHLHYPFYGAAEWLCFSRKPFVLTYHMDAQTTGIKSVLQKMYDLVWPPFIFSRAKKVIVVDSDYFKTVQYAKKVKPENVAEIANGVDTKIFKPMSVDLSEVDLQDLSGKKIISFVGNPIPLKRLDLLLEAIKKINDSNIALVVVGGGYELDKYVKMANELGIYSQVRFVGACANSQLLADYYNISDCFVLSSDYESFGMVVSEAMSCGVPVVGTDIPAIRNRITDGVDGLLFAKGSADDLAAKILQVLAMPAETKKQMGENGRKKIIEKYSWDTHVEKLEAVYGDV
ncbi:MAG: glycosyltransferase family 4 protein [Patescibacteria group bacterium]